MYHQPSDLDDEGLGERVPPVPRNGKFGTEGGFGCGPAADRGAMAEQTNRSRSELTKIVLTS